MTNYDESTNSSQPYAKPYGSPQLNQQNYGDYPQPVLAPWNKNAIASFILGLSQIFLFFITPVALAGVILGHISRVQIAKTHERGSGFAFTGLILSYLGLIFGLVSWFFVAAIWTNIGNLD